MVIGMLLSGCGSGYQVIQLPRNRYEIRLNVSNSFFIGVGSHDKELALKASEICPDYIMLSKGRSINFWGTADHYWIIECK